MEYMASFKLNQEKAKFGRNLERNADKAMNEDETHFISSTRSDDSNAMSKIKDNPAFMSSEFQELGKSPVLGIEDKKFSESIELGKLNLSSRKVVDPSEEQKDSYKIDIQEEKPEIDDEGSFQECDQRKKSPTWKVVYPHTCIRNVITGQRSQNVYMKSFLLVMLQRVGPKQTLDIISRAQLEHTFFTHEFYYKCMLSSLLENHQRLVLFLLDVLLICSDLIPQQRAILDLLCKKLKS